MADEKKPGKAAQFFSKHGEKLGLVAAALALLVYLALTLLFPKEDLAVNSFERRERDIQSERQKEHPDQKPPELAAYVARAVAPWNEVATARSAVDTAGTLETQVKVKEIAPPPKAVDKVVIPEIALGNVEVAIDGVNFSWEVKELSAKQQDEIKKRDAKLYNYQFRKLNYFSVERQAAGGKWEVLADKIPAGTTSFTDSKIEPKTKYRYRVTSWCTDKDFLARVESSGKGQTVELPTAIQTQGIWKVTFSQAMKPEEGKGMVYIEIEKFEKSLGKAVKARHIHYEGDKIGWWKINPQDENEEPKHRHKIPQPGGKTVEVDFNCGMTLVSIKPTKVVVDKKKCERKVSASGFEPCEGPKTEKVTVNTTEINYTNEEGKPVKVYQPDPKAHPQAQDQFCEDHKPKAIIAGPGIDPKTGAPPPPTKLREDEANTLYKNARVSEVTGQRAAAKALFETLLKDYGNTEFVKANKKDIEDRIQKLK